jgi:RNA polymerase sigma-70 factor, ECF subfamily
MEKTDTHHRDMQLASDIQGGDETAFEQLYNIYYPMLFNFALGKLGDSNRAEDFVQDIFVWIWNRRNSWSPQQSVKSYLLRALDNRMTTFFRKKNLEVLTDFNEFNYTSHCHNEEVDDGPEKDVQQLVREYIKELPDRRRTVLNMFIYEGLTYKEISSELGISVNTVDMQLRRARNGLKKDRHIVRYFGSESVAAACA